MDWCESEHSCNLNGPSNTRLLFRSSVHPRDEKIARPALLPVGNGEVHDEVEVAYGKSCHARVKRALRYRLFPLYQFEGGGGMWSKSTGRYSKVP